MKERKTQLFIHSHLYLSGNCYLHILPHYPFFGISVAWQSNKRLRGGQKASASVVPTRHSLILWTLAVDNNHKIIVFSLSCHAFGTGNIFRIPNNNTQEIKLSRKPSISLAEMNHQTQHVFVFPSLRTFLRRGIHIVESGCLFPAHTHTLVTCFSKVTCLLEAVVWFRNVLRDET